MNILIIDGQGGGIGKAVIEQLKGQMPRVVITAVGTNSIATSVMLKAGADYGATGENSVVYTCADADVIIGPIGIVVANSLIGEVTPAMAQAVGSCKAIKLLIPSNRCNTIVMGTKELALGDYVALVCQKVRELC